MKSSPQSATECKEQGGALLTGVRGGADGLARAHTLPLGVATETAIWSACCRTEPSPRPQPRAATPVGGIVAERGSGGPTDIAAHDARRRSTAGERSTEITLVGRTFRAP